LQLQRNTKMKMKNIVLIYSLLIFLFINGIGYTQERLYSNEFPLQDVQLLDGPFKHACDLNIDVLLQYDVDRLLAPYRKEAGLSPKGESYKNWDGLDGHIGGHYLTAMAMNYAATGNKECKKRMEYMISELKACQEASARNYPDWGVGFVGGVPNSKNIWTAFKKGELRAFRSAWVPWYNLHKMYAGLRDAWHYTGNKDAKNLFLKFCDWGINITSELSDEQMQSMLDIEHGGMNEVFADAYQITGEKKYLTAAKRFSHRMLLDAMAAENDNLDNLHANTQVPKAIGFQRIAELSNDKNYQKAGLFFWETVTQNRTLAFGGNSRREHFPSVSSSIDFVNEVEGPESCNSYNMLRLTEGLFRTNPSARIVDYYERTLYNHILSVQHPEHGGYVYFTPARPRHYRVYSAPNEAMWCCVGSGMEDHGKYNQFIYTHTTDSLYLNLFIPSELNWKEKGIKILQETKFPYEEKTKLTISEGDSDFTLMIRYPKWLKEGILQIKINGKVEKFEVTSSSYIAVKRDWKKGDEVQISLPMLTSVEHMPNVPEYIAFLRGPILLAAKTGNENLKGLVADDSRWGHIASGEKLPIDKAPIIIEDDLSNIGNKIIPQKDKPMHFIAPDLKIVNPVNIEFEPFFQIHDSRYMMYWMALSNSEYESYLDSLAYLEKERLDLEKRTVDFVAPGEQQPEADHFMEKSNSNAGNFQDRFWRDARNGGYFSYEMATQSETNLSLLVRYWGAEWGTRKFDIFIDDKKLISEDNTGKWNLSGFQDVEYSIPDFMLKGKEKIRVKFRAHERSTAGAVYFIRLVKNEKPSE